MRTRKWKSEFGLLMNSDLVFSFWISPLEVMMTMPTTPWEEIILIFAKIFEIKTFPISATEEVLRKSIREKTKKSFLERLKSRLETVCTLRDHLKRAADKTCKEIFSWRRPTEKILLGSWHTHTPQWSKAPWTIGTQLHGIVQFANCFICLYLGRYSKMYFGQVINTLIAFFHEIPWTLHQVWLKLFQWNTTNSPNSHFSAIWYPPTRMGTEFWGFQL